MGSFSIWHWMVVLLVVLLLFGSGKVSGLMGDFAKGIKSFKKNMADDTDASTSGGTGTGGRSDLKTQLDLVARCVEGFKQIVCRCEEKKVTL